MHRLALVVIVIPTYPRLGSTVDARCVLSPEDEIDFIERATGIGEERTGSCFGS